MANQGRRRVPTERHSPLPGCRSRRLEAVRSLHHAWGARFRVPESVRLGHADPQAPGVVVIRYEMVHETRVIPLGRPLHVSPAIQSYMGDPRGWWEGDTLVVE